MKRTLSTTFFRRALFLVLLFGGVTNLWGTSLSFYDWTSYDQSTYKGTGGSWDWVLNVKQANNENMKKSGNWTTFKKTNNARITSTKKYTFSATTYTMTISYKTIDNSPTIYKPQIIINGQTVPTSKPTGEQATGTVESSYQYEITIGTAGDYNIVVDAQIDPEREEKFCIGSLTISPDIAEAGGPTPPGPTPTCSDVLTIPCANNYVPITDRKDADVEANSASYGTYEKQTSGGSLYYYVNLPDGTYTISATYNGSGDVWCNYFKKGSNWNGQVSYKGTTYGDKQYHKMNDGNWTNLNLSGEYLISIGCNGAEFTNIIITEQNGNKVFCSDYEPMTRKMYFKPNSNWKQGNEFYQIYFIEQGGDHWSNKLTQNACDQSIYETEIPKDYTGKIIYVRLDASKSPSTWDSKWDQTGDLSGVSDSKNYFDVSDWGTGLKQYTPTTYTVSYAAGDHGTGTMTDSKSPYACGSNVTVLANAFTPSGDYEFTGFRYNSTTYQEGDVITNITNNITLTAQWQQVVKYNITVQSANSTMGSASGSGSYKENAQVEISASPNAGYEFVQWNDGYTDNPRTITVSGAATYTATFKEHVDLCNSLIIQCEEDFIWPNDKSKPSGVKIIPTDEGVYYSGSHPTDKPGYIDFKGSETEFFYYVKLYSDATINFEVWITNGNDRYMNIYKKGYSGETIIYQSNSYGKLSYHELGSSSDQPFSSQTISNQNLSAGEYIIGLYGKGYTSIDQIVMTSSTNYVFCAEPQVNYTWSVYGNFDDEWKDYEMTDGVVTIPNLGRNANYQFKLRKTSDEGGHYTYYGAQNEVNNMTSSNCTNWTLTNTNDGYDINITTGATGSYTFTATDLTGDSPKLSVTYPTAYSITFDDNDADGGTDMTNITNIASGGSETLPAMTRTKTGYRFTGWKDASSNDYADGATIENITSNITLTAQWEKAVTEIAIHMEGGHKNLNISETNQLYVTYEPDDATYGHEIASWVSSNASFVSVSSTGLATAVGSGTATITATTTNGVQAVYNIHVNQPVCDDWYVHLWNGTSTTDYCLTMYDEGTQEMRTESNVRLPSNSASEKITVLCAKGGDIHKADWQIMGVPMVGQQGNCTHDDGAQYYAGQDAVGYFRIYQNSTSENYYIAFQPTYVAMYGLDDDGGTYTQIEFHNTSGINYETDIFQVPDGYKTNENYKYYVGTKRAENSDQSPFIYDGKSRNDLLKDVSGLSGDDWGGKYGKFHIFDNSCDANFYCSFIAYKVVDLYNADTLYYRQSCLNTASDKVNFSIPTAPTGYEFTSWKRQDGTYSVKPTDGDWTNYGMWTPYERFNAVWTPITYNITYTDAGTHTNPATYTIEDTPIQLQTPEKEGYDFVNWTIGDDVVTEIAAGTTGDITLIAHWTPTEYHINYTNLGGAENTNPTTYTIESEIITFVAPGTRTGYTFGAWDPTSIAHGSTGNKTIAASWNLVNYAITYHDAGTHSNPTSYTIESSFTLTAPSARTGYEFLGWYTDAQFTNQITAITAGMHEDKDIYAKWESAYCNNTLTIQCEDDIIRSGLSVGSEGSTPNDMKVIPDDEGPYDKYPNYTGRGYIDLKGNTGATYYAVHLPAATYSFDIYKTNGGNKKLRLYSKSYGSDGNNISYNGTTYKRIFSDQYSTGDSEEPFTSATVSNKTLQEDDYIVALYSEGWASYDKIVITANSKVFCPEMYTVEFAADPSEMGTVTAAIKNGAAISSGTEVPENTVVVFTASNIADNYEVVNWTDDSGNELAGNVTSFEQKITSDTSVTANIAEKAKKYTVTATAGDHGTITSGAEDYREGATVTIVTAPDANYKVGSATSEQVDEFSIDGNNVSFTMPAAAVDVTINFVFDTVHNMIATGTSANIDDNRLGGSGSITKSAVESSAFDHTVLQYDYEISSGNYCGYNLPHDAGYTVDSKATGIAFWYMTSSNFIYMEIKADDHESAFGLENTNGTWKYVYVDNSYAATATSFQVWMNHDGKGIYDGKSMSSNTGILYITEIQATNVTSQEPIVPKVNLTVEVSPNEGGSVTTSPATTTGLTKGTEVTLTATPTPETGYRFANWTVDGEIISTETTYAYTVEETTTIYANFVRVYTLTITNDDHGTATVSPNQAQFAEGDKFTLTAQPTAGYAFNYYMDGENKIETDPYEFTMSNSNRTISVNFKKSTQYFDINTAVSGEGTVTIKVDGETHTGQQILDGTQVTLTATPNSESYAFTQWQDGNTDNPRTITANETNAAITWTATFALRHTVTATFGKPGTKVTGQGEYATGAQVTLEAQWTLASKDFTYGFKEWTNLDGVYLSDEQKVSNPVVFSMPSSNVSMKATFAPVECVDTFVIQCEDDQAYIPWNKQGVDLTKYPNSIPHDGQCGPYHDYYNGYHSSGYYDYKSAKSAEMYYPIELPASTYKFEIWSASNGDKNCWMNLYIESDDANSEVVYKDVYYKKTNYVTANNNCGEGGNFAISGTIENVVINSPKSVIIGLYCGEDYGSFDQIVITADDAVFCEEKDIETFTILSTESKEIPVSGVKNLVVYEGGQATNEDDVEVFETVKYIRSITADNIDTWSTFAVPYTATKTQVSKGGDVDDIYPVYRTEKGEQLGFYFMEVLTDKNEDAIGEASRARWDMSYTRQPQKDSAYITMFPTAQSDGYFIGSEIFYIGDYKSSGGVTLTGSNNARIENGGWPETGKPKYYYFPNSAITAIYPYDAYVLNEDHTMFVLTDHPTILPFQCYIQATTEFKEMYPRIAIRKKDDGGGVTTELIPISVEEMNAAHVEKFIKDDIIYILRDNKIYTIMGQPVK